VVHYLLRFIQARVHLRNVWHLGEISGERRGVESCRKKFVFVLNLRKGPTKATIRWKVTASRSRNTNNMRKGPTAATIPNHPCCLRPSPAGVWGSLGTVAIGYLSQDAAHYLTGEKTFQSTYSSGGGGILPSSAESAAAWAATFSGHTFFLLPLTADAAARALLAPGSAARTFLEGDGESPGAMAAASPPAWLLAAREHAWLLAALAFWVGGTLDAHEAPCPPRQPGGRGPEEGPGRDQEMGRGPQSPEGRDDALVVRGSPRRRRWGRGGDRSLHQSGRVLGGAEKQRVEWGGAEGWGKLRAFSELPIRRVSRIFAIGKGRFERACRVGEKAFDAWR